MKIGFVGGDLRQMTTLNYFKKDGHSVKIYGYDNVEDSVDEFVKLKDCDMIVFPLPSCSGEHIFAPMSEHKIHINDIDLKGCKLVFYAGSNDLFNQKLINSGALCVNYLNDEELVLKNAIATAEGALDVVINETAQTIFGSSVLITGFGRVAKATARLFSGLGADVTISARRREVLAEAFCNGFKTKDISELKYIVPNFNVIINTVPSMIIDREIINNIGEDALVVDLASKPGGVDFKAAKELNKRVIWALSLPGKTAPVTSGEIIYDTISSILKERVV